MFHIPCVIFAGGKSSRMGEDKALLPFGTFATLTQYQLDKLSKLFSNVYISCKSKEKFDFEANFIEDKDATFAPTAAFISIFEMLKENDAFFAISVDTPFIKEATFHTLIQTDTPNIDATIATCKGKLQPLCGIYHRTLYEKFLQMQQHNNHKLHTLLENAHIKKVPFADTEEFLNLNKPHDYEKGLAIINSTLI